MNNELYTFFLVIPPGLEKLAQQEIDLKLDLLTKTVYGGVEVRCTKEQGFFLNAILKTPNRILQRITTFRCRDFPKLFNKIKKIPWNDLLASTNTTFSISSSNSRLFDSRKIEKSVSGGLDKYFSANTPPKKLLNDKIQTIHFRFCDDNVTISLDTSGERLHKRGYRTFIGPAPLRENIAASIILAIANKCSHSTTLIDPMCGSGTFLIEANTINTPNNSRDYLYPTDSPIALKNIPLPFIEYQGFDHDKKIIEVAKENAIRANAVICFEIQDLFDDTEVKQGQAIVCNPPYGKRIKSQHSPTEICQRILIKYNPEVLAIIIPATENEVPLPPQYCIDERYKFENGGLDVNLLLISKIAGSSN